MADELRASLLASLILSEQNLMTEEQRQKIAASEKPIKEFCALLINKYGHDNFRKMYIHSSDTWEAAFEMVHEKLKNL